MNLIAKVDGFPVPECRWFFNDAPLQPSEDRTFETKDKTVSMSIGSCVKADGGVYKLVAENSVGTASTDATIGILGNENS